MNTPEEQRQQIMTVGMALKLAELTRKQAMEEAYRDTELMLRESDTVRQMKEDIRSIRRNRNRALMLMAGFVLALIWPTFAAAIHDPALKQWTTALAMLGDLLVVLYSWFKRY